MEDDPLRERVLTRAELRRRRPAGRVGRLALESVEQNSLTSMELNELTAASQGLNAEETGKHRRVSKNTVETHRRHILHKLEARIMAHAVRKAADAGILIIPKEDKPRFDKLGSAELEVLDLGSQGYTRQEIADIRGVAFETVRSQYRRIFKKLNAHNVTHAVRRAYEVGIFVPPSSENENSEEPEVPTPPRGRGSNLNP